MHLDSSGIVSVVQLIVYIPSTFIACYLCFRHGFRGCSGWLYTVILCLARDGGAICQLVTYTNPSMSLYEAALILESIGVSPLLMATLGLLSR